MIPLFTPATARKDVNKTQGDGELAKLANLNRLVENVNTIVAQGIPAAGPTLTYTNVGPLTAMGVSFSVVVDPADVPNTSGSKTVQSYYSPSVSLNNSNGNNSSLTSLTFSSNAIFANVSVNVASLTTLSLPLATKILEGGLSLVGTNLTTLTVPVLDYVSGDILLENLPELSTVDLSELTYIGNELRALSSGITSLDLSSLSYIGARVDISGIDITSFSLPQMTALNLSGAFSLGNCANLTTINLSTLTSISVADGAFTIDSCDSLTSLNLSSLTTISGQFELNTLNSLTTLSFPSLTTTNTFSIYNSPALTSLSIPVASEIYELNIAGLGITSLSLPSFDTTFTPVSIEHCDNLQSISMPLIGPNDEIALLDLPALTSITLSSSAIGNLRLNDCPLLTSFSSTATSVRIIVQGTTPLNSLTLPNVTNLELLQGDANPFTFSSLSFTTVTSLTLIFDNGPTFNSFNFPNLLHGKFVMSGSPLTTLNLSASTLIDISDYCLIKDNLSLTSLTLGTIGTLKAINVGVINLKNNALNVASVNAILALLVSLDGTNGTTLFTNDLLIDEGTNAAPTGQGLIDKATLQARGCTIGTN